MATRADIEQLRRSIKLIEEGGSRKPPSASRRAKSSGASGLLSEDEANVTSPVDAAAGVSGRDSASNRTSRGTASPRLGGDEAIERTVDPKSPAAAFSKVVRLLNASDKSAKKLRQRLVQDGFDADVAEQAVEKAIGYGLCDDERFARVLIRSRMAQGKGLAGIERELRENGIEASMLDGWPDDFIEDAPDEFDRALDFLEHHPPRSKNLRDGAYRKLVNKGFSSSVASSAARAWSESR